VQGIHITSNVAEIANKTFTYVVVGGGTAGLAVASRLAEDPEISILVIEAGPNAQNDTLINDPGQTYAVRSAYNWQYNTTVQAVGGNILAMTQGKVLGGSSSINGLCWTRGTIEQYDSLERLGNPGWNFKSLFHYMKKAERYHLPNSQQISLGATVDPTAHGFAGKVNAGFPQPYEATDLAQSMVTTARVVIPSLFENIDVASGTPNGVARFQFSLQPGNKTEISSNGNVRSSSANAYVYPSLQEKPNLVILTNHQATRLVWGPRVNFQSRASEAEFEAMIEKEVIIASGAIGSPHFLELSGIGDPQILKRAGIPVEVDLPAVGTNLQDQAQNFMAFNVAPGISSSKYTAVNAPVSLAVAFLDIVQVLGTDGARMVADELFQSISPRARDIVAAGAFTNVNGMEKILHSQIQSIINFKAPVLEYAFGAATASNTIGVSYWNLIPQCVHPEVDPRSFVGPSIDMFLNGNASRFARQIFSTTPLNGFIMNENSPGSAVPENATDMQWQEFVKSTYRAVLHPIGSVPMLPREDGGAVGPDLLVYNTSNVRVVDSSILPVQISAHLSSTIYGIAEKAVDIIQSHQG
ncbi:Glucose oxidase, partial [Termitomyces sp. T112]